MQRKGHARLCLTEARVPSFNWEKADKKTAITSFYMYFYVIPFFSPLKSGTRASLRQESVTALMQQIAPDGISKILWNYYRTLIGLAVSVSVSDLLVNILSI